MPISDNCLGAEIVAKYRLFAGFGGDHTVTRVRPTRPGWVKAAARL